MKSHTENSSYDFDSTKALALVLHVWKHNDLRKVTCLFQRILWLSYISVSTHFMKIDSHDYNMFFFHIQYFIGRHRYPSWIVGDIITAVPLLPLHFLSTIDN